MITPTRKTLQEMGKVYNCIKPHLRFTLECAEDYENLRLPTLDCEIWLEGKKVKTNYYQKPTKTPYTILATSAMPQQMIENSLTQEVVRRLTNTTQGLQSEMNNSLEELVDRMTRSGHSKETTGKVLSRGLQAYSSKLRDHKAGVKRLNRRARDSLGDRRTKKLTINKSWFKPKTRKGEPSTTGGPARKQQQPSTHRTKDNRSPDTALFIPRTPGGSLATILRQTEQNLTKVSKFKVKIVEECGTSLKEALMKSNPWAKADCLRPDCPLCGARREGDENVKGSCKTRSITYSSTCTICKEMGKTTQYIGESGRSVYERAKEHIKQATHKNTKSHIREHMEAEHPGEIPGPGSFRFSVTGSYRAALDRQLSEAIKIARATGKNASILNSKLEFNRCLIPTLVTEDNRSKPYLNNNLRYERDREEEEEEWDDDDNPCKRGRNHEVRQKKPTKRLKPDEEDRMKPGEDEGETRNEKRKMNMKLRKPEPKKTRRIENEDEIDEQTNTQTNTEVPDESTSPPGTQPQKNNVLTSNTSPPGTLPQRSESVSTNSKLTAKIINPSREEFLNMFRRDDAVINSKPKPKRRVMKGAIKCQDIRQFYSFKMQQPPPQSGRTQGRFQN